MSENDDFRGYTIHKQQYWMKVYYYTLRLNAISSLRFRCVTLYIVPFLYYFYLVVVQNRTFKLLLPTLYYYITTFSWNTYKTIVCLEAWCLVNYETVMHENW